jgi:diaminopimelate decarboxylase/aspartate kinase
VTNQWLVLKFGGTSVMGKPQWDTIRSLAGQRLEKDYRVLLVCSALSGVTNSLQIAADQSENTNDNIVTDILLQHRLLAKDLSIDIVDLLDQAEKHINTQLTHIANDTDESIRYAGIASLLATGEWLSTRLGERYLAKTFDIEWIDASQVLKALPEEDMYGRRAWLSARCHSGADQELQRSWLQKPGLLITQGFVAQHPDGEKCLLGRGGSDTTAVLLAARLEARQVEIWTDVAGLFSADPRTIPEARLLHRLGYDEALEMAASGAKVVHPRCIRAAAQASIPVHIGDLGNTLLGTTIQPHADSPNDKNDGIRCVCCQANMAVLLLQNLDMREQVGFLAWVFTQMSAMGVSIDQVATSETTTTVAFNRSSNHVDKKILAELVSKLERRCAVTVYPRCSAINLVGRGARMALSQIDPSSAFFADHPLLMLSQSANDLCISILVHEQHADELLKTLHGTLIEDISRLETGNDVFGPSWQKMQKQ